ncbi:MAG: HlyC/CorC family transporter [Zetaproteobacteria bacterium]|nr:MAG: HlyC/CorC family transporter [Zetaproteobacteria bacterium]
MSAGDAPPTARQRLRRWLLERLRPGEEPSELRWIIRRAGSIHSETQRTMLEQILELDDTRVREVMTPRSEIVALQRDMRPDEARALMVKHGVRRAPLIDGDLDRVVGMIHIWDLLRQQLDPSGELPLDELATPALEVAELQRISSALQAMKNRVHLAVVRDEYGGVAGLVSLSDLLEEIVGPLIDERRNTPEQAIVRRADGWLEVACRTHVEQLEEALERDLPRGDFDTVGGLILSQLQRIPRAGERVQAAGLDCRILEADPRRILRVALRPISPPKG